MANEETRIVLSNNDDDGDNNKHRKMVDRST